LKEKIAFSFIFNEKRVYHRWYGRWFVFGLDYGRLKRVISRISFFGQALSKNGFNFLAFDGPGQAELWKDVKFDLNYYESVSTIIDWLFEHNEQYKLNLKKIATVGFSLGGHLAPLSAAHDKGGRRGQVLI
jgi:alpha-beta hydrolase superfamily lysophospholipase